jgi:hypothetical protein
VSTDPAFVARLDRVQAGAADDLGKLIDGFRRLRGAPDAASREVDLALVAAFVQKTWTPSRMAFALAAAVDRLTREGREEREARRKPTDCPRCGADAPTGRYGVCEPCADAEGWAERRCICNDPPPTVDKPKNGTASRPPGWACPRHGEVI